MKTRDARWAVSFADLCLLLLGFFILLQARPDAHALAKGMRSTFSPAHPLVTAPAGDLFEPGEAILTPGGERFVGGFLITAKSAPVLVSSSGTDGGSARFDGWELAAARSAAIARALSARGVPQARISMQMDRTNGGGQKLSLEAR